MKIPTQELPKRVSSEPAKTTSEGRRTREDFRKLLKVDPTDEKARQSLFDLIEEAQQDEDARLAEIGYIAPLTLNPAEARSSACSVSRMELSLSLEILFEKMASRMVIMESAQEKQTTLFLDQVQFANSSFFGTKIVINEFSTAPKTFNIEIISNPTAIATIQKNQQSLLTLFAKGNFPFAVHRLETQIATETDIPLIHRYQENEEREQEQKKDPHS